MLRKLSLLCVAFLFATSAFGQSAIIRGELSPGVYVNLKSDASGNLNIVTGAAAIDPCQSSGVAKSSAKFDITSATTTALVAVSGTTSIYVCGFTFTISQVITTANTFVFEQGTGVACAGAPIALTGLFGAGGITAGAPLVIAAGTGSGTIFKTAASNGLCALTAIGATGDFHGVLTYVQQ